MNKHRYDMTNEINRAIKELSADFAFGCWGQHRKEAAQHVFNCSDVITDRLVDRLLERYRITRSPRTERAVTP